MRTIGNEAVAIVGAGSIGSTLARRLSGSGRTVHIGVGDMDSAAAIELGTETGAVLQSIPDAAAAANIVILATAGPAVAEVARLLGDALDGKIVVDATNDFTGSPDV